MKHFTAIIASCFLFVSGSAAYAAEKVMYQEITDNKPEVGVSTTVYLGDRMLEQRRGKWIECLNRNFELGGIAASYERYLLEKHGVRQASSVICKQDQSSNFYFGLPQPGESQDKTWRINLWAFEDNGKIKFSYHARDSKAKKCCSPLMDYTELSPAPPLFVYSINTLQQSIEYVGRDGEILKFAYSEFLDGFARQAFTREFQVDLKQGKIAAFKGAVIEIENATNASITYKVVRNFQQ